MNYFPILIKDVNFELKTEVTKNEENLYLSMYLYCDETNEKK